MATAAASRRRRALTQPTRVLLETQARIMADERPTDERHTIDANQQCAQDSDDGDTPTMPGTARHSVCTPMPGAGRDSITDRLSISLDMDLKSRLALIEKKLDWLSVTTIRNFDKLNVDLARSQEKCRGQSKSPTQSPPPPPLHTHCCESSQNVILASLSPKAPNFLTPRRTPHEHESEIARRVEESTASAASGSPPVDDSTPADTPTADRRSSPAVAGVQSMVVNLGANVHPIARCIWEILEDPRSSSVARAYQILEGFLILVSVVGSLVKTMDPPPLEVHTILVCVLCLDAYFLFELMLRYTVCHSTVLFMSNPCNLIDMAAGALSFGMNTPCLRGVWECTGDGTVALTLIVVMPLLRLTKSLRHFHQFQLFLDFVFDISEALAVLLLLLGMIVLLFASIVYLVESRENIPTMPLAMYFIVTTVSTVGYGDFSPTTTVGYMVVSVVILVSIMFMALPLGIIGNSFSQIWASRDHVLLTKRIKDRLKQWGYTAKDLNTLVSHFDANNDGQLELHEFVHMLKQMGICINHHENLVAIFESFDTDAREAIDAKNLTRILFPGQYHELYPTSTLQTMNRAAAAVRVYGVSTPEKTTTPRSNTFTNLFPTKQSAVSPQTE